MAEGGALGPFDARRFARFAGIRTFARLPVIDQVERADVVILGAPFDHASSETGARFGPAAIREASLLLRSYNEPLDVEPFAEAQVVDAGDCAPSSVESGRTHAVIEEAAGVLHGSGARVLALGGDHSVALPLMRAAAARHGSLSLFQLDAHTDTRERGYAGQAESHATIMRRACEERLIDAGHSLQVGLRGPLHARTDLEADRSLGFRTVLARELEAIGVDGVLEAARNTLRSPLYVSVDVDVLDPSYAPGTGTPEPGGLTTRELLGILRGLSGIGLDLVGADVVEVSPPYDSHGITAIAAAGAAFDLLSLMVVSARATEGERGSAP
jgi:agmatinase